MNAVELACSVGALAFSLVALINTYVTARKLDRHEAEANWNSTRVHVDIDQFKKWVTRQLRKRGKQ